MAQKFKKVDFRVFVKLELMNKKCAFGTLYEFCPTLKISKADVINADEKGRMLLWLLDKASFVGESLVIIQFSTHKV